jgi:hypothetical protein
VDDLIPSASGARSGDGGLWASTALDKSVLPQASAVAWWGACYGTVEQGLEPAFEPLAELAWVGYGLRGWVARQLGQVRVAAGAELALGSANPAGPRRRRKIIIVGMLFGELNRARLRAIAASSRPLTPHECAERARLAAALIDPDRLDRTGSGDAVLLWRDEHSEAWLNLWWQPRDTGYHDHTGSCVGVHVIAGRAWNEPLTLGTPPAAREYGPGETFWFPGEGIHRMDHQAGAVTIHVYSPPIQAIGHYDLDHGQLRRTQGLPDQPSAPSTALYEALHPPFGADTARAT